MPSPLQTFLAGKKGGLNIRQLQLDQESQQRSRGIGQETQRLQFLGNFAQAMTQIPLEQRPQAAQRLTGMAESVGVDPAVFTPENLTDESLAQLTQVSQGFIRNPETLERAKLDLRERELEQRRDLVFARPELAGRAERQKLLGQKGLKAEVAGEVKKAESDVSSASKVIDKSFDKIGKIRNNMINLDRAIAAIDAGAETGAISKFVPSITEASRELQQVQRELGLDVVGSVTFGALSEGELKLALDTALDLGQDEGALRRQLVRKKEAQEKLMAYLNEQVQFLDSGGTLAEFLSQKQPLSQPQAGGVRFLGFE